MSAISNRAWTPPGNPVQSKRESLKEANVHFISSVIAHRLLPVLTFQTVFLCGLFHTFHELATFCPQNPSAFLKNKGYTRGRSTHHCTNSLIMYIHVCVHVLKTFIRAFLCYSCFQNSQVSYQPQAQYQSKVFTIELPVYSAIWYIYIGTEAVSKSHYLPSVS